MVYKSQLFLELVYQVFCNSEISYVNALHIETECCSGVIQTVTFLQ
jgi:hypothetical protein